MGTTLDIDDDILAAARTIAAAQNVSVGRVLSDLARQALAHREPLPPKAPGDFPTLPNWGGVVTSELVAELAEKTT